MTPEEFMSEWGGPSLGHDGNGKHIPDMTSAMAKDLESLIRAAKADEREACGNKARRLAEGLESAAEHKDGWEAAMLSTAASTLRSLEAVIRLRREEREGA